MNQAEVKAKSDDPLAFLKQPRSENLKRTIAERRADFDEIYIAKESNELAGQASRCLDCGNPYCEWKCPLHNYIPNWLDLVQKEQFDKAAELMHETNPLPEICGRVCPQDRLCEQACTLNTGFGAVNIGAIEKNISDRAVAKKWRPDISQIKPKGKSVAIVGAGPAGLGCAELLARNGVKPVVYDRYPQIGGLLTFGIPGFKLEKDVLQRRKEFLEDLGVEFRLKTEIGKDISIDELKDNSDALFLGMGCYTSVTGGFECDPGKGVIKALDFLIGNVNQQHQFNMPNFPYHNLAGKNVVVLGGGDTAMDCVRSAVRQNAASVKCIYRRDKESMPGSPQEVKNAMEEGVEFLFNRQPLSLEFYGDTVGAVKLAETELENVDQFSQQNSTRKTFVVNESKTSNLKADVVILAFGFKASPADWFEKLGLDKTDAGLIKTLGNQGESSQLQKTSQEGIYAGGDMVRGADLVVTAIAEGRQAAKDILEYLEV
ncbi:MAG: FAD-dependent oxidoreductase [Kangiellaceae bacterium]|nr:FAD-dependent oxidoreductase [Kangiellaceae bacterium]